MNYAVLGAGGVGGFVGGALSRRGHRVTLILRPEGAERHPVSLSVQSEVLGRFDTPVSIATQLPTGVDVLWVTVKEPQLEAALNLLPAQQMSGNLVIPLMNGIDHVARIRTAFPLAKVIAGSIRVESERTAPGAIRQHSPFAAVRLCATDPGDARGAQVVSDLRDAGLTCEIVTDEATMLWEKLAFLAPLALTTTARGVPLGEIRSNATWQNQLVTCVAEVCQAAQAQGARIDRDEILARLRDAPETMRSSMQRDVEAGRPPELDAIGGPVVRAGHAHHFDVSTTEELMRVIAANLRAGIV
jgi:2-dehydropantoate 2-reductase